MQTKYEIITNNPMVWDKYKDDRIITFKECSFEEILRSVRDRIHHGHLLLTHPLSGSIKPNETPYKSVLVSERKGTVDQNSVSMIEQAVKSCEKFSFKPYHFNKTVLTDFQMIDLNLLESAMASADAW